VSYDETDGSAGNAAHSRNNAHAGGAGSTVPRAPGPGRSGRRRRTAVVITAGGLVAAAAGLLLWRPAGSTPADSRPPARPSVPGPAESSAPAPAPSGTAAGPGTETGAAGPLTGKAVVIDPGHNPGNFRHTDEIARLVDIGTKRKECDTTGTATDDGYTEAAFTRDVSLRLRTLLQDLGATVTFTHDGDRDFGPCIDERARIGNEAAADAVVSVHADGVDAGHRGFHVILPARVREGTADTSAIVGPSRQLGEYIVKAFGPVTGTSPANYLGSGTGLDIRSDLGGLNLSTVPKVFVECGNMGDPRDAALVKSPEWRQKAALGIARGIGAYLTGGS
jgi:N-acetylmuramoyl-L-alanine amidase